MTTALNIAVFDGDGIGPEITAPTLALLDRLARNAGDVTFQFDTLPGGAAHYAKTGEALPEGSIAAAGQADAILLSAMGDPSIRYADGTEIRPQIDLRMIFGLYAGLRPVAFAAGHPTPLALPEGRAVDFVLIRESTEGLFWSMDRGVVSEDEARETLVITRATCEKLFAQAFQLAEERKSEGRGPGRVTLVDKANVFRAFAFMRRIFEEVATHHPDIQADAIYVDAMALRMVKDPWSFDVLVTENMFGDILSDLGAGLMGGLGVAPSADIGDDHAVFQPCHGTAPDIAGRGLANPIAMILSAAMMLEWLAARKTQPTLGAMGARLRRAVDQVIATGDVLTPDLGGTAGTLDVVRAIEAALD
jgi:3-isopropylmalate dehydrogenase